MTEPRVSGASISSTAPRRPRNPRAVSPLGRTTITGRSASRDWRACARWAGVQASIDAGHDRDVRFLFLRQRQRLVGGADRQALEAGALDPARDGVLEPGIRFDDEDLVGREGTHGTRSGNRRDRRRLQ